MITREQMAKQTFRHDSLIDSGGDFESIMEQDGIDIQGAMYVGEQRALRMIAHYKNLQELSRETIIANQKDRELLSMLIAVWIDGLTTGIGVERDD